MFNSSNDAIFVHGINADGSPGNFTEVNDIACERLEYTRNELLAMSPVDIDAKEMSDIRRRADASVAETGQDVFEIVLLSKSGKKIPVEMSSKAFADNGRQFALSIARDITERKRLEKSLKDSEYFFKESQRAACIGYIRLISQQDSGNHQRF